LGSGGKKTNTGREEDGEDGVGERAFRLNSRSQSFKEEGEGRGTGGEEKLRREHMGIW
jgi:hypothetical protein